MRKLKILVSAFYSLITVHPGHAAVVPAKKAPVHHGGLSIKVVGEGWGNAETSDIETLLQSTADQLWVYFPQRELPAIVVVHGDESPKVLFEKGKHGEYLVQLTARDRHWSQYAYQFSHEFCHILANYDHRKLSSGAIDSQDQWFEEALCETAALFTLQHMAASWESAAPYPDWRDYAPALKSYAVSLHSESHRRLPFATTLAAWFQGHHDALTHTAYGRDNNEVVANRLLPLLEAHPEHWEAIGYLNAEGFPEARNFDQCLYNWYHAAPEKHKIFIRQVTEMFGLPQDRVLLTTTAQHTPL